MLIIGPERQEILIKIVESQKSNFNYATLSSGIGLSSLNLFGFFFNLVEVAQEINLYAYLNSNKPLNLEDLLNFFTNFRFFEHVSIFKKIIIPQNRTRNRSKLFNASDQIPPPIFEARGFSSSFLSNASSVLLLVIISPLGILLILKLTDRIIARRNMTRYITREQENSNHHPVNKFFRELWSRKDIILVNIIFWLLLGSIQEIQFFFALQIINVDFSDPLNILSFLCSLIWVVYQVAIIYFLSKVFFTLNPHIVKRISSVKKKLTFVKTEGTNTYLKKSTQIPQKLKEKFSFFFGEMMKENHRGTSYIFFRIFKKMILPLIHVIFHKNVDDVVLYLILFYFCSFLYLRLVRPFKSNLVNIVNEMTELSHINFLFFFKFFVQAVNLKNSELALTLGLYMIYSILLIIILNVASMIIILSISVSLKFSECLKRRKQIFNKRKDFLTGKKEENDLFMSPLKETPIGDPKSINLEV